MWAVRVETNQNESFLTHYGVKGMKWGVRKERERLGTFKPKNASKADIAVRENRKKIKERPTGQYHNENLQATGENKWIERNDDLYKIDKRLGEAHSTSVWLKSMANNSKDYPQFQNFIKDVSSGSSKHDAAFDAFLKNYKESTGSNFNIEDAYKRLGALSSLGGSKNGELSDEQWAELTELTEYGTALMEYYNQTYLPALLDEEMEEIEEKKKNILKNINKAISDRGITLRENQNVNVEETGGNLIYKYTARNGREIKSMDLDYVLDTVEKDSDALKDFRNRKSTTRTREKNVDPNVRAVSVKKGTKKIEVGEKERQQKKTNSPAAAQTKQQLFAMLKLKGRYGETAINRNKIMMEANINRRNKSPVKKNVTNSVTQIAKSGENIVAKYAKQTKPSLTKILNNGKNAVGKVLDSWKKK